jgi:hypothetical protein
MPNGGFFMDKDQHQRRELRIRWWEDPALMTYKSWSVTPLETLPDEPITQVDFSNYPAYSPEAKPVFFGHYWMTDQPQVQKGNVCCLDYSAGKGGDLVAYRFNGEVTLDNTQFVWA